MDLQCHLMLGCCYCGQTGTFAKESDRKYRSREFIDGVREKCIADQIVSTNIASWDSLYNNDETGDLVPLVPIMACAASWRDVKRGGREMCHIANIIYKYPQISSTASSHDLKMMQRTVSHICESILIAALICRVLCVKIKKI